MGLRQRALSVALLVGSVNAACVNFRPAPVPLAASAAGDAPTPVWTSKAGRRFTGQVQVEDNVLYGGSIDRKVYAVDLASGDTRWSSRLPGMILGGVLLAGDTLFVASSRPQGRIQALDRAKGKQIWKTSADPVAAPLAVIEGVLVALTQRGEALGLDPGTGKIRWHRRVGVSRTAAVATGGGGALIATTDSLIRLNVADGRVTHRTASPGTVVSSWLAHGGELLAGTTDSQLVSIRPSDLTRELETAGGCAGARLARRIGRHALPGYPARHRLPDSARRRSRRQADRLTPLADFGSGECDRRTGASGGRGRHDPGAANQRERDLAGAGVETG